MIRDAETEAAYRKVAAHRKGMKKERRKSPAPVDKRQRQPRKREPGFLAFLRRQPCTFAGPNCEGRIDPAHIRMHKPGELPTGGGRKSDDDRCVPLCRKCHDEQHDGEVRFWATRGKDPFEVAAELYRRYQSPLDEGIGGGG